jgi:hypothetical protein
MSFGRFRMVADQIRLATAEGDVGDLVFEPGLVAGSAGTVIRSALIGDLTVDTLQLENESVTVPGLVTYSGPTGLLLTPSAWTTLLEDSFTVSAPAGSTIYVKVQTDTYGGGQGNTDPIVNQYNRIFLNDASVLDTWVLQNVERMITFNIFTVTASGSPQIIDLKWQYTCDWPVTNGGYTYVNGGQIMRVAYKR